MKKINRQSLCKFRDLVSRMTDGAVVPTSKDLLVKLADAALNGLPPVVRWVQQNPGEYRAHASCFNLAVFKVSDSTWRGTIAHSMSVLVDSLPGYPTADIAMEEITKMFFRTMLMCEPVLEASKVKEVVPS